MSQGPALKFVVDIQNEEKIEQLTKDINVQEAAIKRLSAQLRQGAISEAQFTAAATPMGAAIAKSTTEMKALQAASAMTGRGMMQLGYAVDDLQYGFNAIVNNIPQIAMGFGATAGIAGAIAVASVAVNILIKHWGDLSDIAQSAWSGGSVEQLKNMREAAEKAAEGFKKLAEEHTKMQEAQAKFAHEAIVEAGVEKVRQKVTEALMSSPFGAQMTEDEKRKAGGGKLTSAEEIWAGIMGGGADPAKFYRDQANKRRFEANRVEADRLTYQASRAGPEGDAARAKLRTLGNLPPDVTNAILPESAKAQSDFEKAADARKKVEQKIKAADAEHLSRMEKEGAVDKAAETHKKSLERHALEEEKRVLSEQIKRGEHLLTPEGKQQLQDKLLGGVAPHSTHMLSAKGASDKLLIDSLNRVPERQLKKLADMHLTLKDIDKKMRALGLQ